MSMSFDPGPTETQSSPVDITESATLIRDESPMWIPSVLGLSSGAIIRTPLNSRSLEAKTLKWKCLLLTELISRIDVLLTKLNLTDWERKIRDSLETHRRFISSIANEKFFHKFSTQLDKHHRHKFTYYIFMQSIRHKSTLSNKESQSYFEKID